MEYSLSQCKYTKFSRGLEKKHPVQWLTRGFAVNNITFDDNNEDIILLQDDNAICVINKNKVSSFIFIYRTLIHRMIIVEEHRHPLTVAKSYSSPSLYFPKPAHFPLHCIVQCRKKTFVYL